MKKVVLIFLLLLLLAFPAAAAPFDITDVYGLMPNAKNPANRNVPVFVLNTGVDLQSNALNYQIIPLLNAVWDDEEREWIGSLIGDSGLKLSGRAIPTLGLNIGFLGLQVGGKASVSGNIPKHFTDLMFYGLNATELIDNEMIVFEFADLNGHGAAYLEAGITLAHTRNRMTMGLTAKYLYGLAFADAFAQGKVEASHGEGSTAISGQDVGINVFHSLKGTGYSFDVGARYYITNRLAVEASVLNIGQIQWMDGTRNRIYSDGDFNLAKFGFDVDEFDFIFETDESEDPFEETEETGIDYAWKLPLTARVGADWDLTRSLRLAGEVSHTTYFQEQGKTSKLGIAGGMEYRFLWIFPIRISGEKVSNEKAVINGGMGLHLGPIRIDASVYNILGALKQDSRGFGAGLSTTLKF